MNNSSDQNLRETLPAAGRTLRSQVLILGGFVALIWFLELVDWLIFRGSLDSLGIQPRTLTGLRGILFMPFLHDGLGHLLANTLPFIVLGWMVMVRRTADFFIVTVVTMAVSGLGVWLFGGSRSVHLGASGLIFGYFGYLLLRAYFERSAGAVALALLAVVLYGGMLCGIVPLQVGISWQAHLFGFLGGVLAAAFLVKNRRNVL